MCEDNKIAWGEESMDDTAYGGHRAKKEAITANEEQRYIVENSKSKMQKSIKMLIQGITKGGANITSTSPRKTTYRHISPSPASPEVIYHQFRAGES